MTQLKNILAATDLSEQSLQAVERGFLLARSSGARYEVMHALGLDLLAQFPELPGANLPAFSLRLTEEAREALAQIVADPARNHGATATPVINEGLAITAIPAHAGKQKADLIVVGAHGSGFLQRFLLGSTASRLLRKSRHPVLVVKQPPRENYRRALVAIDFSPGSALAIQTVRAVAPRADLVLLHIFEVPFESKLHYAGVSESVIHQYRIEARERAVQQLHALAASAGLKPADYTALVLHGDATRQILSHAENCNCDLIVMGKHGTHVTEELLLGSATKRVLAESQADVLVVVDKRLPDIAKMAQ